jgi:Kef-type K+ transport system membrane component KefB
MSVLQLGSRRLLKSWAPYVLMLAASVAIFLWIRSAGSRIIPSGRGEASVGRTVTGRFDVLPHILLALILVIGFARLGGWLFRGIHQPAVIGEVVAGIVLGPSLLGRAWPDAASLLFPSEIGPFLNVLAQVGVIVFMFLVGLELDMGLLRQGAHSSVAISHASILAPFLLGSTAALWLYPTYSADAPFPVFSLFLGVSLSVTAFPVLARILIDRGIQRTRLGALALTCAAVDDLTAWCLLALLLSVSQTEPARAVTTVGLTLLFITAMLMLRPLFRRLVYFQDSRGTLTQGGVAVIFMSVLTSALATEWIGIHALFGAFLLGAVIPHDSLVATQMREKLEDTVVVVFLPAFFAYTGLRTEVGLLHGFEHWTVCGFIIIIASLGKFGGSYVAARLSGLNPNTAASIGVLMNTRGLMELVVLNLGLDLGILSPTLFAMFIIMALVTTAATSPILHYLCRAERSAVAAINATAQ